MMQRSRREPVIAGIIDRIKKGETTLLDLTSTDLYHQVAELRGVYQLDVSNQKERKIHRQGFRNFWNSIRKSMSNGIQPTGTPLRPPRPSAGTPSAYQPTQPPTPGGQPIGYVDHALLSAQRKQTRRLNAHATLQGIATDCMTVAAEQLRAMEREADEDENAFVQSMKAGPPALMISNGRNPQSFGSNTTTANAPNLYGARSNGGQFFGGNVQQPNFGGAGGAAAANNGGHSFSTTANAGFGGTTTANAGFGGTNTANAGFGATTGNAGLGTQAAFSAPNPTAPAPTKFGAAVNGPTQTTFFTSTSTMFGGDDMDVDKENTPSTNQV